MRSCTSLAICSLLMAAGALAPLRAQQDSSTLSALRTVAESTNYRATAKGSEVELFLKRVHKLWSGSELQSLGKTVEGRDIWALVVPATVPESATVTVLLLGGIHAGECDGKEALLALARDYATDKTANARKNVRLIFVPNFNADGNERVGRLHRPGQDGPADGMGIRENAQGLDLNRDFVKLETPEVRALVSAIDRFKVDVMIDAHTTNGSLHRYDMTYAVSNNPATPPALDRWLRDKLLPTIDQSMAAKGMPTFYYGNFEDEHKSWKSFGHEPRYSTELMGMRGKIGILAESYSYATYQRRIEATYAFVDKIIEQVSAHGDWLRAEIDKAATANQPGASLPIAAELAQTRSSVKVLGYQGADGQLPGRPFGPQAKERYQPHDYSVDLWVTAKSKREIQMPHAYVVAPEAAWALSRLQMQGVEIQRLSADTAELPCEVLTIAKVEDGPELQNHKLRAVKAEAAAARRALPAGNYVVRTAQPLGRLAAYCLEPESEDGLAAWNFFDPDLQPGWQYPIVRVLGELPADKLQAVKSIEPGEPITLEHIFKPGRVVEYSTTSNNGATWLEGTNELVLKRDNQWLSVDPQTGASQPNELLKKMRDAFAKVPAFKEDKAALDRIGPAALSANRKFGLHTYEQDLYLFDADAGQARRLTSTPKAEEQLAELSPTGAQAAFVRDNDLYLVDCQTGEERRLTHDGSSDLLNGILDWVYQEEIYGRGQFRAFWFSPDGQQLAFLQLDQTPVHRYSVSDSIHYRQELEETRYPKAGDPLPIARMWLAEVATGQLKEVSLSQFPPEDRLVVRVTWSPKGELWLQVQNRIQNEQSVLRVDAATGASTRALYEKSPGWIEVLGQPKFLPDGDFLWLSDLPGGRRHLYRFDVQTERLQPLTKGDWDIADLQGVTPDGRTAFVTGNYSHPIDAQLISVDTQTGQTRVVTPEPGVHRPRLSADCSLIIDSWSSLTGPPRIELKSTDGQLLRVLGAPISDRYQYVRRAEVQQLTIPARDGLPMQALIMLPESYRSAGKLPVLFHVYAGPQAPTVNNAWAGSNYWWHQYLCSQGYAVVLCDNRSSRGRGISDTWKVYRDLGKIELQDIEDAVDYIAAQSWADPQRVGIWGWSYGGYMTAYALTHSQKFKAGISGAPVTDWRNYDAVYTERYMDLPQANKEGYRSSSAVEAAGNLHGRLLLLHGERDDNVHISNTLQLAYALQKAGKPFEMMVYPKNRHGIVDTAQRYHMYQHMTDFLNRNLK